jgi:ankyrin repeat protein
VRSGRIARLALEVVLSNTAEHGLSNSLRHLVYTGVNFGALDNKGKSAAIYAIGSGHQKIALLLHSHGAELENLSKFGAETLRLASSNNNLDGVKLLLGANVPIDSSGSNGYTPLIRTQGYG